MTENAIVNYDPGRPLGRAANLQLFRDTTPEYKMVIASLDGAWPGDIDPQRRNLKTKALLAQAAITISTSERPESITNCCQASIIDSLTVCASLDLSIQKALGEAYLVPFAGVCTLMIGYRGFIKLLVNTGYVTHVESILVYESEKFLVHRDETGPHWTHPQDLRLQGHAEKVTGCYAVGYTRGAAPLFEYLNAEELEKIKRSSKAVQSGKKTPYDFWATEMMRKAPIRRLQKYVPKTADNLGYDLLARAAEHDNQSFDLTKYTEAQADFMATVQERKQSRWTKATQAPAQDPKPLLQDAPGQAIPENGNDTLPDAESYPVEPPGASKAATDADKRTLVAQVEQFIAGKTELTPTEIIQAVMAVELPGQAKLETLADCEKILAAIKSGNYDLASGDLIPF